MPDLKITEKIISLKPKTEGGAVLKVGYQPMGRALHFPPFDTASPLLPDKATRSNKWLLFDAYGRPAAGDLLAQAPSGYTVSPSPVANALMQRKGDGRPGNDIPSIVPTLADLSFDGEPGQVICLLGRESAADGGQGSWTWLAGDYSAEVAADTLNVIWKQGASAPTIGVWKRSFSGNINVKWSGAKGDGLADDTLPIRGTIAVAQGSVIDFPDGVYKHTELLDFENAGIEGTSPRGSQDFRGGVEFAFYGTGYAMQVASYRGQTWQKFTIRSYGPGQSGLFAAGNHIRIKQVSIRDFDTVGMRVGSGSGEATYPLPIGQHLAGGYYSDISEINIRNDSATKGLAGFINDGGFPSTNANGYANIVVGGGYDVFYDIAGTNNNFYKGDCTPNGDYGQASVAYRIGGTNNRIENPYFEAYNYTTETAPNRLIHFLPGSWGCRFEGQHSQIVVPNYNSKILDEGTGNNVKINSSSFNLTFPKSNNTHQNLVANSKFTAWNENGVYQPMPKGWGTWNADPAWVRDDIETHGGNPYSMRATVNNGRCNMFHYFAQDSLNSTYDCLQMFTSEFFRGKTIVAGVWCKSSTPGLGNIKIVTGSQSIGNSVHSGSGDWEFLTAMARIDDAATYAAIELRSDSDGANRTGTLYFCEPVAYIGPDLYDYEPRPLTEDFAYLFGPLIQGVTLTLANNNGYPDVSKGNLFYASNTSATNIQEFRWGISQAGRNGHTVKILPTNGNTTVVNGSKIKTNTGANKTLEANKVYTFTCFNGVWYESA